MKNRVSMNNDAKEHKCEMCDKSYTKKFLLNKHKKIHTEIRAYKCQTCEECFKTKPMKKLTLEERRNLSVMFVLINGLLVQLI